MKNIIEYLKNEGLKFESYKNERGEEVLQVLIEDKNIVITNISDWLIVSEGGYDYFKYEDLDVISLLENRIEIFITKE
ncbi:hypothetical protein BU074_11675 [Mammaliicoccus vitulinus]|uniref:hypothetical protein n=1 Tax=Mammaliicoccus vitulinus TaxID=71237 RepID=UPI000D1E9BE7|nr:hypothetical protein [Mammaliicoccus vitulinus]PTI36095.1 hypothetical protein BU074_11675 [Mammaliicoccus vitulinus]